MYSYYCFFKISHCGSYSLMLISKRGGGVLFRFRKKTTQNPIIITPSPFMISESTYSMRLNCLKKCLLAPFNPFLPHFPKIYATSLFGPRLQTEETYRFTLVRASVRHRLSWEPSDKFLLNLVCRCFLVNRNSPQSPIFFFSLFGPF